MYSSTTLIGHLGQDPETRVLDSGSSVTRLSLATSRSWKNAAGEKQEETQWHNVVLWNKLGELAQQYLRKGSKVLIVGQLKYRTSEHQGTKRYFTDVVASEMKFMSSGKQNDNRFPTEEPITAARAVKHPTAVTEVVAEKDSDDLPF